MRELLSFYYGKGLFSSRLSETLYIYVQDASPDQNRLNYTWIHAYTYFSSAPSLGISWLVWDAPVSRVESPSFTQQAATVSLRCHFYSLAHNNPVKQGSVLSLYFCYAFWKLRRRREIIIMHEEVTLSLSHTPEGGARKPLFIPMIRKVWSQFL